MRLHASCAALNGAAVLLVGKPGCGKSDLLLRLVESGFDLVADDQVLVAQGVASAPKTLAGLLEVRGLGIFRLPSVESAPVALVVELDGLAIRLPQPRRHAALDVPVVQIDASFPSAVARIRLALDCACGRAEQLVGALAA